MRQIRVVLIVLLVLLTVGQVATTLYMRSLENGEPPVIHCPKEPLLVSTSDPKSKLLTGMTAEDPQDGDLTDGIIIGSISRLVSEDMAKVTFLVFDSDNNAGSCVRYIRYTDYHRPRFSVLAPLVCTTTENLSVINHLTATDVVDGDISDQIRISTLSPTENPEIYLITVQVINSMGDIALQDLPVLVQPYDAARPKIVLDAYLVYVEKDSQLDPKDYLTAVNAQQDISLEDVVISGNIDTSKAGTYHAFYTCSANGSTGTAILTVVVQ